MSLREVVRKLLAVEAAGPIPRYSTKHVHLAQDPLFIAFVRMAGESRPWAIAYGRLTDAAPTCLAVADGRNRDLVAGMCEAFAQELLLYMRAEGFTFDPITKDSLREGEEFPQLWLPGAKHIEMLHHLEYAFWRRRKDDARTGPLSSFARLCGWLHREASMPGQQVVIDAAQHLRDSYAFPCDDYSLGHLGAELAWLSSTSALDERRGAAREAGFMPVSPTLDPELDRRELAPRVEVWNDAKQSETRRAKAAREIEAILKAEVERRWELTKSAFEQSANDGRPENTGLWELMAKSWQRYVGQFQRVERELADPDLGPAFTPHPETDFHGAAAASNYYVMVAADTAHIATLIHDDAELQSEALASGHAFLGEVVEVEDLGSGRAKLPHWTLEVPVTSVMRIREGERYAPLGAKGHSFIVREISAIGADSITVVGEFIDRKTMALTPPAVNPPLSPDWIGEVVMFVPKDSSTFDLEHSRKVWAARSGPGAWLTHGRAPQAVDPSVVDDITQLENL